MNPERWKRVDKVLQSVLEQPADRRAAYLDEACAGDEGLRGEVESLIASYEKSEDRSLINSRGIEAAAPLLGAETPRLGEGREVGHYVVLRQIGAGGMGEVYLARDTKLDRNVALKVLPAALVSDAQRVQRFEQEARAASALNHPNILTIYEVGETEGTHFIATEFIDGETLRRHLAGRRLKLHELLDLAIQIAAALDAAHEAGIVHRDVKPENVMVRRRDGIAKVLDFGLAKLAERTRDSSEARTLVRTEPGLLMGTVAYMSPEQTRGQVADARTDIWSLGVLLYEMLAGRLPFEGADIHRQAVAIQDEEPPPLPGGVGGVLEELRRIVSKALTKDAGERYQTAKELQADLRDLKRRLELDAEIERSLAPGRGDSRGSGARAGTDGVAAQTGLVEDARATSSAEYIANEIRRHKKGAVLALSFVAVAALAFGLYRFAGRSDTRGEARAPESAPADSPGPGGSAKAVRTLAVLPFKPLSGGGQNQELGIGMTDALITKLSNVRQIVVRPTSAVLKYSDPAQDSLAAGREQGVDTILEGRVQRSGDRVRVTVQLLRVGDGAPLWAEAFDGKFTDIFAVQDSISERAAAALQLELTGEERGSLTKRYTESTEAYQLYLKGRHVWGQFTPESHRAAIKYFEQAIARDPNYALAYAGLSEAYSAAGSNSWLPPREAMPRAKRAALKAVEIDDSLGEAHTALGAIALFYEWDWDTTERELKRAVSLNPNYPNPHQLYSYYLLTRGRFDEAIAEAERAYKIDPLSPKMYGGLAEAHQTARHYDRAIELYREVLEIDPGFAGSHAGLGATYEMKGMYEEAIAEYQRAVSLVGRIPIALSALGHAYAMSGKRSEALAILDELKEMSRREPVSPYDFAVLYRGLGDRDRMFEQLDRAFEERSSRLIWLKVEPLFDPLRSDPRFTALLERLKL